MLFQLAFHYKKGISDYQPYPAAEKREYWDKLPEDIKEELILEGEKCLNYQYAPITAALYMEFTRSGDRVKFEEVYLGRRRTVNSLILAECAEGKGRFLEDIINGLMLICEESGWQLPAHNYYLGWSTIYNLPDKENPMIDLFVAETGALIAVAAYLLKKELDEVSPFIVKRIDYEIRERILMPYLKDRYGWAGGFGGAVNNWTTWITQNVLIALFTRCQMTEREYVQVLQQASMSLDYFLEEYGEDGCCNEGPEYYRHAGLCFYGALEVLNTVTDNSYADIYKNSKIINIATYIMKVSVGNGYYFNYGDCSCKPGFSGTREFLFARSIGDKEMMTFAARDHQRDEDPLSKEAYNLFYRLQAIVEEEVIKNYKLENEYNPSDAWFESTGLLIARDKEYVLSVKGGGNNESHNHNDTGSFILYKNEMPVFIDVGVETYCYKTFSPERYSIWTMQSLWHNVCNFGENQQQAGEQYYSRVLRKEMNEKEAFISLELANVYPENSVKSYIRTCRFVKGKGIEIVDEFDQDAKNPCLTLMTLGKPVWENGILQIGSIEKVSLEGVNSITIDEVSLEDKRLRSQWGGVIYRTLIVPDHNVIKVKIGKQ